MIWREVELLREKKPVIVSMGSYAASGGYYISCGADAIVADKTTATGSIGVFGMFLRLEDALKNKLGITFDAVRTNTSADMGVMRPLTGTERAAIMRSVDEVYELSPPTWPKAVIAAGKGARHCRRTGLGGTDALALGLVDTNGGLKTAIAIAADKAELGDKFRIVEMTEAPTGFRGVLLRIHGQSQGRHRGRRTGTLGRRVAQDP